MMGNVGDDNFGKDYLEALEKEGIDASGVRTLKGEKTGVTNIIVEDACGENMILFVANANEKFGEREELVDEGMEGDVVVFQLEIPLETVSDGVCVCVVVSTLFLGIDRYHRFCTT